MPLERMQQRRDTTARWASVNPVLLDGEIGIDLDLDRYKIGDGTTPWLSLPFADQTAVDAAAAAQAAQQAAEDARDDAQDISGISTSDDVVRTLVVGADDVGPGTRNALIRRDTAHGNPLQRVRFTRTRPVIVALYGMSITSFYVSPGQMLRPLLKQEFGSPSHIFDRGGIAGGTFSPSGGIDKQPYGGRGTIRARIKNTSTAPSWSFYGDTYDFTFSRETNAQAVDVLIDGVAVTQTPGPGSQQYGVRVTGTVTRGQHFVTLGLPSAGSYVYWEDTTLYDSTEPGVIFCDFTVGGTSMRNMRVLGTPGGGQVDGIPIVGDNGVKGCYENTRYDLIINGHDVNDAVEVPEAVTDVSQIIDLIASYTSASANGAVPVLHISSMAGHYAVTSDPNKVAYDRIKRHFVASASEWGHISHFDWDGLTRLPQDRTDAGDYQAAYYTPSDFIHPTGAGSQGAYSAGSVGIATMLGLPIPTRTESGAQDIVRITHPNRPAFIRGTALGPTRVLHSFDSFTLVGGTPLTWRFTRAHGLAPGDEVVFMHDPANSGNLNDNTVLRNRYGIESSWFVVSVLNPYDVTMSETQGGAVINNNGNGTGPELVWRVVPPLKITTAPAGYGTVRYSRGDEGVIRAYHTDSRPVNGTSKDTLATIDAGSTDLFGKYQALNGAAVYGATGIKKNEASTVCLRVNPGNAFSLVPHTNTVRLDRDGNPPPVGMPSEGDLIGGGSVGEEPIVVIAHMRSTAGGPPTIYVQGNQSRVYDIWWVPGLIPILNRH